MTDGTELARHSPVSLTAVILACNERRHIGRAVACLEGLARRVVVVDSGSTDGTQDIARSMGAEVVTRRWVNHAEQLQWALDHCAIDTDWVLRLDADEIIRPDLAEWLRQQLPSLGSDVAGVSFDRRDYFLGRWIRHGGRFPLTLVRIWRAGQAKVEPRWMDEHMTIGTGRVVRAEGTFDHIDLNDLTYFTAKHNGYATREAIDALIRKYRLFAPASTQKDLSRQARRKRWLKERVFNRMPLGLGPLGYFLQRYIFQLGFLDGRPGLIYHLLQGFWYRFLVDAKKHELELVLADAANNEERIDRLAAATGHDLRGFQAMQSGIAAPADHASN